MRPDEGDHRHHEGDSGSSRNASGNPEIARHDPSKRPCFLPAALRAIPTAQIAAAPA